MMLHRIAGCLAVWMLLAASLVAQDDNSPNLPSLNSVVWNGPGTSLEMLREKTVVVFSYVTWCPKCNEWAPEMLGQLKAAIQDKPIVVLAISTEAPSVPGPVYMARMKFDAPNILHGHDPTINRRFGFRSLMNFAIVSPEGQIVVNKQAGTYYNRPNGKLFTVGKLAVDKSNTAKFDVLDAEMSDVVKQVLWPLEMGHIPSKRDLAKVKRLLNVKQRDELQVAIDGFLEKQIEYVKQMVEGEVPDQIQAYETANLLALNFRGNERVETARDVVTRLKKDRTFRTELAARAAYAKTLALINRKPERREQLLGGFAKRFAETYFGQVAADSLNTETDSTASESAVPVSE